MDLQMPRMDGMTATRHIRALPNHGTTPILAMTANAFEDDRDACLGAGMNDHIAKPVSPQRLYTTLIRWLPDQGRMASGQASSTAPDTTAAGGGHTPTAQDSTLRTALAAVPGIQLDAALRNVLDRPAKLVSLLKRFALEHANDARDLQTLLATPERDTALRLVHTLKGLAGTLGLHAIQQLALTVEKSVRAGADVPTLLPDMTRLDTELTHCCHALAQLPDPADTGPAHEQGPDPTPTDTTAPLTDQDRAALQASVQQLQDLLASDDLQAARLFDTLRPQLQPRCDATRLNRLARHLDEFAFDLALKDLQRLAEGLFDTPT